jgi:hypothetical protein
VFPANGSLLATPPFPSAGPGEPSSPLSAVLWRRYDFPSAEPRSLIGSLPQPTRSPLSCPPRRSRRGGGPLPGQGFGWPVALITRLARAWTRMGSLRSSGDPSCAFAVFQDPGRTDVPSSLAVTSMLPPRSGRRRLRQWLISGLTHSFGTCCRTLHASRCRTRARLASGWPARPLPGGSRTLWVATRGFCSFVDRPPLLLS